MFSHSDWPHAWAASTVRDAKGFVQIDMTHVCAQFGGLCDAHHRIEVCSIEVNLSSGRMHHLADISDPFLKYPMRGGVGDHHRS